MHNLVDFIKIDVKKKSIVLYNFNQQLSKNENLLPHGAILLAYLAFLQLVAICIYHGQFMRHVFRFLINRCYMLRFHTLERFSLGQIAAICLYYLTFF